jgi:hypothetical protein
MEEWHKTDVTEIGYESLDWIKLAQYSIQWRGLVNTKIKLRGPLKADNFLTS